MTTMNDNARATSSTVWGFLLGVLRLLVAAGVIIILGSVTARYLVFSTVRSDVYGFFRESLGVDQTTAFALALLLATLAAVVVWKLLWSFLRGRVAGLLAVFAIALLGWWGLVKFAAAPMSPFGKPNMTYAVIDGRCQFFDIALQTDPATGVSVQPVTERALQACRNLTNGKTPRPVNVSDPARVEWFDTSLGHARIYFVRRPNGDLAFFDAPGADPLLGTILQPVTSDIVQQLLSRSANAATLADAAPPSLPVATPEPSPAPASAHHRESTVPAATPPRPVPSRVGYVLSATSDLLAYEALLSRLPVPAESLPADIAWPLHGAPGAATLQAARNAGFASVIVMSLVTTEQATPELAGFHYVRADLQAHQFDTQTGARQPLSAKSTEGRAFDRASALRLALNQL
jgi:hypothetical protein